MQRRCYWLLSGDDGTVLVHYLAGKKAGKTHTALLAESERIEKQIWDTAREYSSPEEFNSLLYSSKNRLGYQPQLQDTCMGFDQVGSAPNQDATSVNLHSGWHDQVVMSFPISNA